MNQNWLVSGKINNDDITCLFDTDNEDVVLELRDCLKTTIGLNVADELRQVPFLNCVLYASLASWGSKTQDGWARDVLVSVVALGGQVDVTVGSCDDAFQRLALRRLLGSRFPIRQSACRCC